MRKYKNTEFPHIHNSACEAQIASRDELSAYIDKELPVWKRYFIQQHLKKCGICAGYVQRLRKTDKFLRQSGEVEVSTDFLAGVMTRVSEMTQHQRQQASLWSRIGQRLVPGLETSPTKWFRHLSTLAYTLRQNIQTRSPIYIFVLTFCVFTMVGVTLYPSRSDRFRQSAHAWKKSDAMHNEKLISFEVIRHDPPKRLLMTNLSAE